MKKVNKWAKKAIASNQTISKVGINLILNKLHVHVLKGFVVCFNE